jgi:hypothetical protein
MVSLAATTAATVMTTAATVTFNLGWCDIGKEEGIRL